MFTILFIEYVLIKYNIACNDYFIEYGNPDFVNIGRNVSNQISDMPARYNLKYSLVLSCFAVLDY